MIIDTHIHESKYSWDSHVSLKEIVIKGKAMGLDGICITNHESNEIMDEARQLAKENNFLILVGAEILTYEGDLLVFGLPQLPDKKMHAQELINLVLKHKGVAISAHPYRKNNRGIGNGIRNLENLSGIEALNGNTNALHNLDAYKLSLELEIPSLGGSDAHCIEQVGKYVTVFPNGIRDEQDFIDAVNSKNVYPAVHKNNGFVQINTYKEIFQAV
jgi:predicted metal-dependent phosphoesterase TrpH